jgi:hypothetical protein
VRVMITGKDNAHTGQRQHMWFPFPTPWQTLIIHHNTPTEVRCSQESSTLCSR